MNKFIIKDWADNHCFKDKRFPSFESAWGFLYEKYESLPEKEFDEQMSEYFVYSVEIKRKAPKYELDECPF